MELDTIYEYWDEASEARDDISKDYGKRLMNGCKLLAGFDLGFLGLNPKYKVQVKQSPYFLIMVVASLAAEEDPENKDSISDEKVLVGGLCVLEEWYMDIGKKHITCLQSMRGSYGKGNKKRCKELDNILVVDCTCIFGFMDNC